MDEPCHLDHLPTTVRQFSVKNYGMDETEGFQPTMLRTEPILSYQRQSQSQGSSTLDLQLTQVGCQG